MEIRRGGRVPVPQPQGGPTDATGGHLTLPCLARRRGARERATGHKTQATKQRRQGATTDTRSQGTKPRRINILQWNAEGVYQKKISLEERLRQEDIEIACLQETHLKENQRFNVRGYQTFRQDRVGRTKGGIALLVKNTLSAKEFSVSTNDQAEIQGANIVINNQQMEVINVYSPPDRDLSLDQIPI